MRKIIRYYIKKFWYSIIIFVGLYFISTVVQFNLLNQINNTIDTIIGNNSYFSKELFNAFLLYIIFGIIIFEIGFYLSQVPMVKAGTKFDAYAMELLLNQKQEEIDKFTKGEIKNIIEDDIVLFRLGFNSFSENLLISVLGISYISFKLIKIDFKMWCVYFIFQMMLVIIPLVLKNKNKKYLNKYKESNDLLTSYELDLFSFKKQSKFIPKKNNLDNNLVDLVHSSLKNKNKYLLVNNIIDESLWFMNILLFFTFYAIGSFFVSKNMISIGELTLFILSALIFKTHFSQLVGLLNEIQKIKVRGNRIEKLLLHNEESGNQKLNEVKSILFKNVSFGYNDKLVIKNLNLEVRDKSKVQLKGDNGIGKSTIFKLITKLYEPSEGIIEINNIDLNDCVIDDIRSKILYVNQDFKLLEGTVAENLEVFLGNYQVRDLKFNLSTEVKTLSPGEKNQLLLSILKSKNFDVLLVDELDAHLDKCSREELIDFITNLDKTVILISHLDNVEGFKEVVLN